MATWGDHNFYFYFLTRFKKFIDHYAEELD